MANRNPQPAYAAAFTSGSLEAQRARRDAANAAATAAEELDPTDFPRVARPDIADVQGQIPAAASESPLGRVAGFMDNIVPDDMGGIARGTSGWTANIPGYAATGGAVQGAVLSGGETVIDAMTWGSEQMDHLGAAIQSAAPGGMKTLTWEEAQKVSYGQAAITSNAQLVADNGIIGAAFGLLINPVGIMGTFAPSDSALKRPDFDPRKPLDSIEAFSEETYGQWSTGILDAIWDVAADPTIIGGKASAILRTGAKAGKFGGLSNQALRNIEQVRGFGRRVEDGVRYATTNGAEGKWTAEAENVKDLISKAPEALDSNVYVKSSSNPLLLKRLAAQIDPEDLETGAALVRAGAGDAAGWSSLRTRSASLYDQLSNGMGVDPLDLLPGRTELTADQLKLGQALAEDAAKAIDEFQAAGQLITRGGNRVSAGMARTANAYRAGAASHQFGTVHKGASVTTETSALSKDGWTSTVVQKAAGSRPIRVLRWMGTSRPAGIVHIKGGEGNESLLEVRAFLQKSSLTPEESAGFYQRYTAATTPTSRRVVLEAMEEAEATAIAAKNGVGIDVAKAMYASYAARRKTYMASLRDPKNGFAVDDTGEMVRTPGVYTELDESFPMMDQTVFHRVTKSNATWLRGVEDATIVMDTVNTWWKLSVLLRLGYTQRNITEGALRSVAALGLAAVNPSAMAALPANIYLAAGSRRLRKSVAQQEKALLAAQKNMSDGMRGVLAARAEARDFDIAHVEALISGMDATLSRLRSRPAPSIRQRARVESMEAHRARYVAEAEDLRAGRIDPDYPDRALLSPEDQALMDRIDRLSTALSETATNLRAKNGRRRRLGKSGNTMEDGAVLAGAFQGPQGDIAALVSSADRTTYMTFDAGFEARRAAQEASRNYKPMDPRTMKPEDAQRYWDEYAVRLNQHYRNDEMVFSWLRREGQGGSVNMADTKAWLMSPAGAHYRKSVSVNGRKLQDRSGVPREDAIDEYLSEQWRRYNNELPEETGLRAMVYEDAVTPAEIAAAFGTRTPPAIPVKTVGDTYESGAEALHNWAKSRANNIMRGLGSIPETKLLRHPFYNSVYRDRQKQLYTLAARQGQDMSSGTVLARINKAAHSDALKATKSTMYTIERMSNTANMLRWVSPFFPAFENSLRVWGRMAYTNPAIIGYGNLLWNVPNNLGWVVDENGNKVEQSNMFKDEGNKIILPMQMQKFLEDKFPDFITPGAILSQRQHGFNVIFPGSEWWWAGVGPMAQTSVALVLRGKPETQDVLRSFLSEEMYRSIVPSGDANTDLVEVWLGTAAKRVKQMVFKGTDEDGAYLTLTNMMVEDAYIDAQIAGHTLTQRDMKIIDERVQRFWKWQIRSGMTDFTTSAYVSPHAVQRKLWQDLLDDQSLDYKEKLDKFMQKTGGADFLAVTRSGTFSEYGLQPTLSSWQKIIKNPDLVEQLNNMDPSLVGMFANMGSFDDPFSYSVYGEYRTLQIGSDGRPVREQFSPAQLLRNNEITDGWREWRDYSAFLEEQLAAVGFKSVDSEGAEEFKILQAKAEALLKERYPAWAQEKEVYVEKLPVFISAARLLIQNAALVEEDPTMSALAEWIQIRDHIARERGKTEDQDLRKELSQIGYEAAAGLRNSDIGFADLFDRYLATDDFREL